MVSNKFIITKIKFIRDNASHKLCEFFVFFATVTRIKKTSLVNLNQQRETSLTHYINAPTQWCAD